MKPARISSIDPSEERPRYHERYIGLNVYYVRKTLLRVSQEEFAALTGISKDTVSNIERGVYLPSIHNLINICNHVNMPIEFFLHDNNIHTM